MAIAFVKEWTQWQATSPASSGSFTPGAAGNTLVVFGQNESGTGLLITPSAAAGTQVNPPATVNDTNGDTHAISANLALTGVSQVATLTGAAGNSLEGEGYEYSGVASAGSGSAANRINPGAGAGAITGNAVSVPVGSVLVAICKCVSALTVNQILVAGGGTTRGHSETGGTPTYAVGEYAGTGGSITPSFTDATNGAGNNYEVLQIVLGPPATSIGVTLAKPRLYPTSPGTGPVLTAFKGSTQTTVFAQGAGAGLGTGIAAALLAGAGALSGAALGTSIAQANLTGTGALSGAPLGTGIAQADGIATLQLSGAALGTGIAQAALTGTANCSGAAIGTGIAQSLLAGSGTLAGSALGTAVVQGFVADSGSVVAFSGAALGTDISQAALTATGTLTGAPMGTGLAQALLTATATLNGSAIGTGIAQALLIDAASLTAIPGAAIGTSIVQGFLGIFVFDQATATPGRIERLHLPNQVRTETEEEKRQRRIRQGILPNPAETAKARRAADEQRQRELEAKLSIERAAQLREITATIRKLQANAYRAKREAGRLRDKALALEQSRAAEQQMVALRQQIEQLEMEQRIAETMIEELDIVFVAVMLAVS